MQIQTFQKFHSGSENHFISSSFSPPHSKSANTSSLQKNPSALQKLEQRKNLKLDPPKNTASSHTSDLDTLIKDNFKQKFGAQAHDPKAFGDFMNQVYGEGYDQAKAEQYRQRALQGDYSWLPPIRFLNDQDIRSANGAYNKESGTVYLNEKLKSDPRLAAETYLEEMGHHLDTQLNKTDAPGDEGQMFRRLISGEKLSADEVQRVRTKDDHGTITVDGKKVEAEFWDPIGAIGDAFNKVKDAVVDGAKAVGGAVVDGVKAVGGAIAGGVKTVAETFGKAGEVLWNGIKTVGKGVLKVGEVAGTILDKAMGFAGPLLNFLPGIGPMINVGWSALKGITALAKGDWKGGLNHLLGGLQIIPGVGGMLPKVFGFGEKLFQGDFKGALQDAMQIGRAIPGLNKVMPMIEKVVNVGEKIVQFGTDLAQGDWKGALSQVADGIRSIPGVGTVIDKGLQITKQLLQGDWEGALLQGLQAVPGLPEFYKKITDSIPPVFQRGIGSFFDGFKSVLGVIG